jgi:hypothetical protein
LDIPHWYQSAILPSLILALRRFFQFQCCRAKFNKHLLTQPPVIHVVRDALLGLNLEVWRQLPFTSYGL